MGARSYLTSGFVDLPPCLHIAVLDMVFYGDRHGRVCWEKKDINSISTSCVSNYEATPYECDLKFSTSCMLANVTLIENIPHWHPSRRFLAWPVKL